MAIRIGDIWDGTTDVLAGRAGLLTPVAALAFFLPAAIQAAITSYGDESSGMAALKLGVGVVALVATIWGQLTVIGIASSPDTTRAAASAAAVRRLAPALLVTLICIAAAVVAILPIVGALIAGGFDFQAAMGRSGSAGAPSLAPGAALFCGLYTLALLVLALWLTARLFVWAAVVLHERRGIGALGRSFTLTRGLALKLIGVSLLFGIVYLIAAAAAQFVVGIVSRLLLGAANIPTATWLGALAAAIVGAAFSVVVATFSARLYAALVRPTA